MAEAEIAEAKKRVTDLTAQTGQPFEYADKLGSLVRRQQEITDALDLTKNQASVRLKSEADALKEEYEAEWL